MSIQTFPAKPVCRGQSMGFSMIELLVALTIVAILLALAMPSMVNLVMSRKVLSLSNVFLVSVNLARSEAVKRNDRVVLCKSVTGLSCITSGGWDGGWILFHDPNNNAQLDTGETVLRRQDSAASGLSLTGNAPVANYISVSASGVPKLISGAFQAGTLTLCTTPASDENVRQIILSATGRARVQAGTLIDCG